MLGETTIKFFKSRTPILAKRKIKLLEKLEGEAKTLHRSILTLQCIGVYGYPLFGEKPFWGVIPKAGWRDLPTKQAG